MKVNGKIITWMATVSISGKMVEDLRQVVRGNSTVSSEVKETVPCEVKTEAEKEKVDKAENVEKKVGCMARVGRVGTGNAAAAEAAVIIPADDEEHFGEAEVTSWG